MIRVKRLRGVILLCVMLILGVACSRDTEEKKTVTSEPAPTSTPTPTSAPTPTPTSISISISTPIPYLTRTLSYFQAEVVSFNQVNLSWNRVEDAARYVIVRETHGNKDKEIPGPVKKRIKLVELSGEETSYQDTAVKAGGYYQYNIYIFSERAARELDGEKDIEYEKSDWFESGEEIVHIAVEGVFWETTQAENTVTSPNSITMMAAFNPNPVERIEPTRLEIFRGDDINKMEKLTEISFTQEDLIRINGDKGICYTDNNVEAGKAYYYQARAYAEVDGKKEYGYSSFYLKKSAVLPEGDYSMSFAREKGKNASLELSLQGNIKGNAKLQFIGNQFNGLVDYVYQKENTAYEFLSMGIAAYRQGNGKWVSYQGQPLCLEGEEKIDFRFVPWKGKKAFVPPEDGWKSAEIILLVLYDDVQVNLHFDLNENKVFLTSECSEAEPPEAVSVTVRDYEIPDKKNSDKRNPRRASVPDVSIYKMGDDYGDLVFKAKYTKKNRGNVPDGVEIYRSSDNKSFSFAGTAEYPKDGDARYSDSGILPGEKWYYKARNYIDTDDGRVYGRFAEYDKPFYAGYYLGGRYKMWLDREKSAKEQGEIVVRLYSYSLGNPLLRVDYFYSQWKLKEYSRDGIHWKKWENYARFPLAAKEDVYLKMKFVHEEGHSEGAEHCIGLSAVISEDDSDKFVNLYYDMAIDKMAYTISWDD